MRQRSSFPIVHTCRGLVAVVLVAVMGAVASSAEAQSPLACPDDDEALTTYQPDYISEGDTWSVSIEGTGSSRARNLTVSVNGTVTPIALDSLDNAKIVMPPVETAGRTVNVSFDWDQDIDTQAACHGHDDYAVPYAHAGDKVGNVDTGRLQGSYRAKYTHDSVKATWRLTPTCDLLACNTKLRSSGGIRGTLNLRPNGTYAITDDATGFGECTVRNNITGATRKYSPAYTRHRLIVIRATDDTGAIVKQIAGDVTDTYRPTRAARTDGCTGVTKHSKLTLTRK